MNRCSFRLATNVFLGYTDAVRQQLLRGAALVTRCVEIHHCSRHMIFQFCLFTYLGSGLQKQFNVLNATLKKQNLQNVPNQGSCKMEHPANEQDLLPVLIAAEIYCSYAFFLFYFFIKSHIHEQICLEARPCPLIACTDNQ